MGWKVSCVTHLTLSTTFLKRCFALFKLTLWTVGERMVSDVMHYYRRFKRCICSRLTPHSCTLISLR
jgi:hypothetical protein